MPRIAGTLGRVATVTTVLLSVALAAGAALADPLAVTEPWPLSNILRDQQPSYHNEDASISADIASALRRQVVAYSTSEPAGTIIIDTASTYLYLVLGGGRAIRYGIGVGRDGFTWSGTETVVRKAEWPDWYPPDEMIQRQPYLPRVMAGGPGNPLGARALYLGNTQYRIHGTNQPGTIGKHVSSGCIRMLNSDVIDLFNRVSVGTRVVVLHPTREQDRMPTVRARTGRTAGAATSQMPAAVSRGEGPVSSIY